MRLFIFDLIRGTVPHVNPLYNFTYWFGQIVMLVFFLMYLHQMIYLVLGTLKKYKLKKKDFNLHTIGIVISARNESSVIGNLIKSIRANDYPQDKLNIFVVADNCTDNTAQICRDLGCIVIERFNKEQVGKGYALNYLFTKLHTEDEYKDVLPDAYLVLDADNIIKPNFITEINKVYDSGYEMVTSYRNSKNFGQNWITSGYGYWFIHEARHLSNSRMMINSSCAISGTGFLISRAVVKEFGNWEFFTLTEDIQCSTEYALTDRKVGYAGEAELFDEQPSTFKQSWRQRERWAKGFYQVFAKNGGKLVKHSFKNFACWDILTTIFPALFITMLTLIVVPTCAIIGYCSGSIMNANYAWYQLWVTFSSMYVLMFVIALLVCITEWKKIKTSGIKKILYLFTFPFFMFTYIPISLVALFKKVEWKPIVHTQSISINDLDNESSEK